MYSECLSCNKLGNGCDGPNFMAMSPEMLAKWIDSRMKVLGMTNQKLADLAQVAKGTIDTVRAGKRGNFEFETMRRIMKALVGESWGGDPCPYPPSEDGERLLDKVITLEGENQTLIEKCETLLAQLLEDQKLHQSNLERAQEAVERTKKEAREDIAFLKEQITFYKERISFLTGLLQEKSEKA